MSSPLTDMKFLKCPNESILYKGFFIIIQQYKWFYIFP